MQLPCNLPAGNVCFTESANTHTSPCNWRPSLRLPCLRQLIHFLLLLAGSTLPLTAQIDRTELNGIVTDPSGATLPAVTITIRQEGTNQSRVVTSDKHGQFVASSLPIGRFAIVFACEGFNDLRIADIDLHSGDVRTVNAQMKVGSINQT